MKYRRAGALLCVLAVALALCIALRPAASCAETQPRARSILVLDQSDGLGPLYVSIFSGLRTAVSRGAGDPVTLYVEHVDLSRFSGPAYEANLSRFLREKYAGRPIGVVVALGTGALDYVMRWRAGLWPEAPVVFAFADPASVEALHLPADVTGTTSRLALADMVKAAEIVMPQLRRLAIVGDRLETQPAFRPFAAELPAIAQRYEIIDLTGLPMLDLLPRLRSLPGQTAILYTAIYSDGHGTYFSPAEALPMFADAANGPIIASVETFIGRGAIGGIVKVSATIGEEAAQRALAIIDGRPASSFPISEGSAPHPMFDWRQLQRWGVDEGRLPAGSEVRYRSVPIWRQYPVQTAAAVAIVLLQSGLIIALLNQYRRRRRAELESGARLGELARVNRFAIAGELSASLAHQLNQPLGAVLANAEAAERLLQSPASDMQEIRGILVDVKRDSLRASAIIAGLRRLLKRADARIQQVDANQLVDGVFGLALAQAVEARVELARHLWPVPLRIHGDEVQLQQVVLNLLVNAIEATRERPDRRRVVTVRVESPDRLTAAITVEDTGPGIAEADRHRVFEPFYSTKPHGMGMGLAIARTIVERHQGSIEVKVKAGGGGVFRVTLPLAPSEWGAP